MLFFDIVTNQNEGYATLLNEGLQIWTRESYLKDLCGTSLYIGSGIAIPSVPNTFAESCNVIGNLFPCTCELCANEQTQERKQIYIA